MGIGVDKLVVVCSQERVLEVDVSAELVAEQYFHDFKSQLRPAGGIVNMLGDLVNFLHGLRLQDAFAHVTVFCPSGLERSINGGVEPALRLGILLPRSRLRMGIQLQGTHTGQ